MRKKIEENLRESSKLMTEGSKLTQMGLHEAGRALFLVAAALGNSEAAYNVGFGSYYGLGCKENLSEAVKYFAQAENKVDDAKLMLGLCYYYGHGIDVDKQKAMKRFQQVERNKYPGAIYMLGNCHRDGVGGVKDIRTAVSYYRRAAKLENPGGLNELAYCYLDGKGVEKNLTIAFETFKQAATHKSSTAEAKSNYGMCLLNGIGCKKNEQEAAAFFVAAKNQLAMESKQDPNSIKDYLQLCPLALEICGDKSRELERYQFAIANYDRALNGLANNDDSYTRILRKKEEYEAIQAKVINQKNAENELASSMKLKKKQTPKPRSTQAIVMPVKLQEPRKEVEEKHLPVQLIEKVLEVKPDDEQTLSELTSCEPLQEVYTKKNKQRGGGKPLRFMSADIECFLNKIAHCTSLDSFLEIANKVIVGHTPKKIREALAKWYYENPTLQDDILQGLTNEKGKLLIAWQAEQQRAKLALAESLPLKAEATEVEKPVNLPTKVIRAEKTVSELRVNENRPTVLPTEILQAKPVAQSPVETSGASSKVNFFVPKTNRKTKPVAEVEVAPKLKVETNNSVIISRTKTSATWSSIVAPQIPKEEATKKTEILSKKLEEPLKTRVPKNEAKPGFFQSGVPAKKNSCRIKFTEVSYSVFFDIYSESTEVLERLRGEILNLTSSLLNQGILCRISKNPGMSPDELSNSFKCIGMADPAQFPKLKEIINSKATDYHEILANQGLCQFKIK